MATASAIQILKTAVLEIDRIYSLLQYKET